MQKINWNTAGGVQSYSFTCGYCGSTIASEKRWAAHNNQGIVYICHQCTRPTFIDFTAGKKQSPGDVFGNTVQHIPEESVSALYDEARSCTGAGAYTAAVLSCRKLLMHIAVSKGAEGNKAFAYYVTYLSDNHFVPPDAGDWVDHIRNKGNEANHEITIMPKDDAEELLSFCEMLLKVIYEFPTSVKNKYLKLKDA